MRPFFLSHSFQSVQTSVVPQRAPAYILERKIVLLQKIMWKVILSEQALTLGAGETITHSSSVANVSAQGTPVHLLRTLMTILVSFFSSSLQYFVVGETLTNGLFLICSSTLNQADISTGFPSYSSPSSGSFHSPPTTFYSPFSMQNFSRELGELSTNKVLKQSLVDMAKWTLSISSWPSAKGMPSISLSKSSLETSLWPYSFQILSLWVLPSLSPVPCISPNTQAFSKFLLIGDFPLVIELINLVCSSSLSVCLLVLAGLFFRSILSKSVITSLEEHFSVQMLMSSSLVFPTFQYSQLSAFQSFSTEPCSPESTEWWLGCSLRSSTGTMKVPVSFWSFMSMSVCSKVEKRSSASSSTSSLFCSACGETLLQSLWMIRKVVSLFEKLVKAKLFSTPCWQTLMALRIPSFFAFTIFVISLRGIMIFLLMPIRLEQKQRQFSVRYILPWWGMLVRKTQPKSSNMASFLGSPKRSRTYFQDDICFKQNRQWFIQKLQVIRLCV